MKKEQTTDHAVPAELEAVRLELDRVDREIVALYKKRMELSASVARIKRQAGRPVLDARREEEKIKAVTGLVESDMDKENVEELFRFLMSASRRFQHHLMQEEED
ncbi:MAG: chorismate mutase [Lachnospiraceae bacterium]|nr:chorismate mutase [Lachnospiraceae bacterium]